MRFVVHCLDKPDGLPRRLANYEAHKKYLSEGKVRTVVFGPLVADDGETIFDASAKEDVIAFNANDPFAKADVRATVNIHRFLMRVDNRG
jgi:uncharacterized protein YciI